MWPTKKQVFLFFFGRFFCWNFGPTVLDWFFSSPIFFVLLFLANEWEIISSSHILSMGGHRGKWRPLSRLSQHRRYFFFFFTFAAWPCERHRLIISLLLLLFCCWNFYWSVWPLKERFLFSYFFRPVNTLRTESAERRKSRKKKMGKQTYVINLRKLR